MRIAPLAFSIGLFLAQPATAQALLGDVSAGKRAAQNQCGSCHAVSRQQLDPGIGPSFFIIADHPSTTAMSLSAYLQTPHASMPNIMLSPEQTEDIVAYILSLHQE